MDSFQDMSLKSHESQSHEKKLIELISEVSKQQMQQQKLLLELLNSRPTTPAHIPGSDSETHDFLYPKQQAMLPQATSHLMVGYCDVFSNFLNIPFMNDACDLFELIISARTAF